MTLAADLIKLNNLKISSKLINDELKLGMHVSKKMGTGVEFEQYKHYQQGDNPKAIDWKLYARSGKHQIKLSTAESAMQLNFIIDATGSMNYKENGVSRLDVAKLILAALAYIGFKQNDHLNLYSLESKGLKPLVLNGKQSFQRILYSLENLNASGTFNNERVELPYFKNKQKEMLILVSDLWQAEEELINTFSQWASPHNEVLIIQLLGKNEVEFNLKGTYRFKNLEGNETIELSAEELKKGYLERTNQYLQELDLSLALPNVSLLRCTLDEPVSSIIKKALDKARWNS